jgi:hypothetical protein
MPSAALQHPSSWTCRILSFYSMKVFRLLSIPTSLQVTRPGFALFCALKSCICSHSPAAFVVARNDSRVILREITHNQTFVVPGSFSLIMNMSDHSNLGSLFESFFKNVTDSVMDAFKRVVSAQSVYTLSGTSDYKVHPESGHIVFTASAYVVAFNFNASASFDEWSSLAVSLFQSKTSSPAFRNLVSPQTLQARATYFCALVLCSLFRGFPLLLCSCQVLLVSSLSQIVSFFFAASVRRPVPLNPSHASNSIISI